jgi:very-short-patch-repair endonuclease
MAIVEKEVWVNYSSKTYKYYESIGYIFPRKNKKGKDVIGMNTKILIKTTDLLDGSRTIITKVCDDCGSLIESQKYYAIIKGRKNSDGKDRCKKCSNNLKSQNIKINIESDYMKSLEYYSIKNKKEYLQNEFSIKNNKKPCQISKGTKDIYLWNCFQCGSEYEMNVNQRVSQNQNCPFCAGYRVNKTNCLQTKYPEISREWHPTKNGEFTPLTVTAYSSKKFWWKCSKDYKHIWESSVNNRTIHNSNCPVCNESKGERKIRNWLTRKNIKFKSQKEFEGLLGLREGSLSYDFYLPQLNMLIEYQGEFHDGSGSEYTKLNLENQKEHDKRKRDYAESNGIRLLEIWHWDFENIEDILESKLNT